MPSFTATGRIAAPVEEVWKLLHDPSRFPEWWDGVQTVADRPSGDGDGDYTMWPTGYPDFPMPQRIRSARVDGRVTISCLVSDLEFRWQLRPDGEATRLSVEVTLPDREAHRTDTQRGIIDRSIARLRELAATG